MRVHRLLLVRHGERLDEVNRHEWAAASAHHRAEVLRRPRHAASADNDAHLTAVGAAQAEEAAEAVLRVIAQSGATVDRVYSSQLVRAVQTADKIAARMGVPVVLSKTLSRSAAAVERLGKRFDFLTADELKHFAPDAELLEIDENHSDPIAFLRELGSRHTLTVVVAHRESIRDLVPAFANKAIPYCAIASFDYDNETNSLDISHVMSSTGEIIMLNSRK